MPDDRRATDEQRQQARDLGLTFTEMDVALKTHIAPETYAAHKREMQAERDAWDAKVEAVGATMTDHPRCAVRRPVEEQPPSEDGG